MAIKRVPMECTMCGDTNECPECDPDFPNQDCSICDGFGVCPECGGEEDWGAPKPEPDNLGHVTRIVDAATHDERCDRCGATDARGDDRLTQPCPNAKETGQ